MSKARMSMAEKNGNVTIYKYWIIIVVVLLSVLSGVGCGGGSPTAPTAPSSSFNATPVSGTTPLSVKFTDASTDATGWSWDFDNNGTADSTSQNPTYIYSTAGTYTVKLTVTGEGGTDDETKTNYITVTAPATPTPATLVAGFTSNKTSGAAPLTVQFTDTSTGGATSWSWDFDNNGTADSTQQNPSHIYTTVGSYYVKLNVENSAGTKAHMIHQITVTQPVIPYVYDPDWWNDERLVWYYAQPLGSGDQQYYNAMAQTGVGAASWLDLRFAPSWETTIGQIVTNCHNMGVPAVGTLSMMSYWHEGAGKPTALNDAILLDPFGNQILDTSFDPDVPIHSMIHPDWVDYLKDCIERTIDLGVDGFLLDELTYGTIYEPDFTANTMEMFRQWLEDNYDGPGELAAKGITNIAEYDYAQVVRDSLLPGNPGPITSATWTWDLWGYLPLSGDYQRFLREANRDTAETLVSHAKTYASTTYSKTISVTANISDMTAAEALYIVDLLDYVNLEWHYIGNEYFPTGRAFATAKLAEAFGKPSTTLTDMATRADIKTRGTSLSTTLYQTMIADAYAGGGAFHLEQGGHQLVQDLTALAPYYNFVPDNPGLFNDLTLAEDDIGVLHLWEAIDSYKAEAYRGVCNLLADTGYQFETIFGAEEYTWWGEQTETPAPLGQTLVWDDLDPYEAIIIPELRDITENHAELLLQYANGGGKLIVFASPGNISAIHDHRVTYDGKVGLYVDQLLDELNGTSHDYVLGRIIHINTVWGLDYLPNLTASLKGELETKLTNEGLEPTVDLVDSPKAVSAFAHKATGKQVIHLVNYNYNAGADTTPPVTDLELDIDIGALSESGLTVTLYTPEVPSGTVLTHTVTSGTVNVTVPTLGIWGVLVLEN
ncbi:PKD domain-containing protein [Chloroflexota bacterium]